MSARNGPSRRGTPKAESPVLYSIDAEKAVLGCMIAQPDEVIPKAAEALVTLDFFVPAHQEVFRVVGELFAAGEVVDVMTVHQRFVDGGQAESLGSPGILAELLTSFATHLNVGSYIELVARDSARRHRLVDLEQERERIIGDPDFLTGERGRLSARDAIDLVSDNTIVEPPVLVSGMLHKGSALLLGASSKSFKSWSLIDLAISVASGARWWDLPCEKGRVLFVDFELTAHFWRKRAVEIAHARALDLNRIRVLNCRGHSPDDALRAIDRESTAKPFDLIAIDPLYSFLAGKDENSAGDVGAVMRRLAMLSESTGAALAISHHFSKGSQAGKDSIDRFSGSGVFARFPDALLTMTRHEEDGAFSIDPTVRHFAPLNPFVLRWNHPLMVRDGDLNPARLKQVGGRPEEFPKSEILALLQKPMSATEWLRECEEAGCKERNFYSKKKELVSNGAVIQTEGSKLWMRA